MEKQISEIFNKVRDIPYYIPITLKEDDFCCSGKSLLLKKELDKIGIESRFSVGWFYWSSMDLPISLMNIPHDEDCTHTWVEIYLNNKWIKLDPSWDSKLSSILPIAQFDGENDTVLAVKIEEYFSPEKSKEIVANQEKEGSKEIIEDLERNRNFYKAFNEYLESIRNK